MTKICEYCKCEYNTWKSKTRYCSPQCYRMANRKLLFLRREAQAKELGVTIEEVESLTRRGLIKTALEAKRLGLPIEEAVRRKYEARYAETKALAADAGMGVKAYIKRFGMARERWDRKRRPKTYSEICAYNKAHPLVDGWRR